MLMQALVRTGKHSSFAGIVIVQSQLLPLPVSDTSTRALDYRDECAVVIEAEVGLDHHVDAEAGGE